MDIGVTPGGSNEADGFGGVAREDDLTVGGRGNEASDSSTGVLVLGGGESGKVVNAAVDIGVLAGIEGLQTVCHLNGLLRGGGRVEVHKTLTTACSCVQDGEVAPNLLRQRAAQRCSRGRARSRHSVC